MVGPRHGGIGPENGPLAGLRSAGGTALVEVPAHGPAAHRHGEAAAGERRAHSGTGHDGEASDATMSRSRDQSPFRYWNVCSAAGNAPVRTSAANCSVASVRAPARSA